MENAADALVMAGSVLIFIIALTVAISSFSNLRVGIDQLIDQTETVDMAQNAEGYVNFIKSEKATRVVGVETVVSSMYRSYKENFTVYIVLDSIDSSLADVTVELPDIKTKDGNTLIGSTKAIKITSNNNSLDTLLKNGLYKEINGKTYTEYLGVYQNNTVVTDVNKTTYRIITYVQQ